MRTSSGSSPAGRSRHLELTPLGELAGWEVAPLGAHAARGACRQGGRAVKKARAASCAVAPNLRRPHSRATTLKLRLGPHHRQGSTPTVEVWLSCVGRLPLMEMHGEWITAAREKGEGNSGGLWPDLKSRALAPMKKKFGSVSLYHVAAVQQLASDIFYPSDVSTEALPKENRCHHPHQQWRAAERRICTGASC